MKVIMTSSIGGAIKENGKRLPAPLFWYNGFLEKLQSEWVNNSKVMIIAASPDDYEKNDENFDDGHLLHAFMQHGGQRGQRQAHLC